MLSVLSGLENACLPFPKSFIRNEEGHWEKTQLSIAHKVQFCASQAFSFLFHLLLLGPAALYSAGRRLLVHEAQPKVHPLEPIREDEINKLAEALPDQFGFSQSIFQDEGSGATDLSPTQVRGICNWNDWVGYPHIEGMGPSHPSYKKFFVRILEKADSNEGNRFVHLLEKMAANGHRFSFEWALLEPVQGEPLDRDAIQLYKEFLKELKAAGVEPWGTLHHFVLPQWAQEAGGFNNPKIRDHFVKRAVEIIELFPEVTHWMTFNEPTSYGMQSYIRGAHPPGIKGDFEGMGEAIGNMLLAHTEIYRRVKENPALKDRQIGLTHQWLKFLPAEGNLIETLTAYSLTKITHYCVYNFFKTGRFAFEVPGKANIHFEIPEEEFQKQRRFLDFIAPQFYGFPRVKAGWNGGRPYPGYPVTNLTFWKMGFSFGTSCKPGGQMQAFGPPVDPGSLRECLQEASELGCPIAITETGCDAMIAEDGDYGDHGFKLKEEVQKGFFVSVAPILREFKDKICALFIWTLLRGQLEWDRGDYPALGLLPRKVDRDRNLLVSEMMRELTPSAELIQKVYAEKQRQLREQRLSAVA